MYSIYINHQRKTEVENTHTHENVTYPNETKAIWVEMALRWDIERGDAWKIQ